MLGQEYSQQALDHWTKFLPTMVAELRQAGRLNEAVQTASREASEQVDALVRGGMQKFEAEEIVLPDLILLPPETK